LAEAKIKQKVPVAVTSNITPTAQPTKNQIIPTPQSVETQSTPFLVTQETPVFVPTLTPNSTSKPHRSSTAINFAPTSIPIATPTSTPIPQKTATVEIQGLPSYKVNLKENDTAFSVLLRASEENNFTLSYQYYGDLGAMINCISGICGGKDQKYWMFYYNGQFSSVGASSQPVFVNDVTTWKFE